MNVSKKTVPMYNCLITCEHASNRVPEVLQPLLGSRKRLLDSHRSWDRGALEVAVKIAESTGAKCISAEITRLAVDCNRSEKNRSRFSSFTRKLSPEERAIIDNNYYHLFRNAVERYVLHSLLGNNRVLHFSVHSFTPILHGIKRTADIGLLYDPSRNNERQIAGELKRSIVSAQPSLVVRFNYPYRGISDSTVSWLRGRFSSEKYCGIELEINQRFTRTPERWRQLKELLAESAAAITALKHHNEK